MSIAVSETGRAASATSIQLWSQWIVLGWFAGIGTCLTRLAVAWRFSRGLVRSGSEAVPAAVAQMFESIVKQLNIRKGTRLLMSVHIPMPAVIGWLRPAVLLPICAVTNLSEEQLRAVLAHELAHIRRHDFLINTLQRFVESILFYHPAVWWLSSRTRRERENCCDDLAIQTCGDVLAYAEALIALERSRPASEPTLALSVTGGPLTQRIRRLLGHDTTNFVCRRLDRSGHLAISAIDCIANGTGDGSGADCGCTGSSVRPCGSDCECDCRNPDGAACRTGTNRTNSSGARTSGNIQRNDSRDGHASRFF
jgi:beta-lactamase regulating signal transducer with metallopeptidase domain